MDITVEGLTFRYTGKPFIQNMCFQVKEGEIFGFLGPSGAGKSTLQKILTGLLPNYTGTARLGPMECREHPGGFYEKIGVDFEYPTLYEKLTARQNLQFFGSLYQKREQPIDLLLEEVGLAKAADQKVSTFSKGMRSRLSFIKALLHDPEVLFLDEPTSGLDPANSRIMKDMILAEKAKGKTILLTTHNMADAGELCDRVAFIVEGAIAALDSPHALIMGKGAATVTYTYQAGTEKRATSPLSSLWEDALFLELLRKGQVTSIHTSEPDLSSIFLEVTGRQLV